MKTYGSAGGSISPVIGAIVTPVPVEKTDNGSSQRKQALSAKPYDP
jgi:hypothetical protein